MPKYYDTSQLKSETDQEFVREMLQMFVETTPAFIEELNRLVLVKEAKRVADIMHRLKPSLRILHVKNLASEAQDIEAIVFKTNAFDPDRVNQFNRVLEESIKEMKAELSDLK